jgi:hypothetical protein
MRETLKNTTNSSVYNKLLKMEIALKHGLCLICFKRSGGDLYRNCDAADRPTIRNWKYYRKTQYKI